MKKIAVILSGCGFLDGSEIYETVLTLLAIDRQGAEYQCFAPDIAQRKVINFLNQQEMTEERSVLIESARLARGNIIDIAKANPNDFDALVFPGGFGAALNLSNFAEVGADCEVQADVLAFAKAMVAAKKPIGFICISPAMIPVVVGPGVAMTIGNDAATAATIESMGATHVDCPVREIVIDEAHKVVSTPAYMLGKSIAEVGEGIEKLVVSVLGMVA